MANPRTLSERVAICKGWRQREDGKWELPLINALYDDPPDYTSWERQHDLITEMCDGLSNVESLKLGIETTTMGRGTGMTRGECIMVQWLEKFVRETV